MKMIFAMFTVAFLTGCATTTGGYWRSLDAKKIEATFHTGKYVGRESGCFPPPNGKDCRTHNKEENFIETGTLDVEKFSIRLSTDDFFAQGAIKDMIYLAAADLTLQRGYKLFTVIKEVNSSACRSFGTESRTSGSLSTIDDQSFYSGRTTTQTRDICYLGQSIDVLLMHDISVFSSGIFFRTPSFFEGKKLLPLYDLYYGTVLNLKEEDYAPKTRDGVSITTPKNAWKTYYTAQSLSTELRSKYKTGDIGLVPFKEEVTQRKEREAADAITRNKVLAK